MKLRAVLFDKDGTLIDFHATWMPVYRQAVAMVARAAGRPGIEERLLALGGYEAETERCSPESPLASGTTLEIAALWSRETGVDEIRLKEKLEEMFNADAPAFATPVEDLHAVLARLEDRGMKLGLATMDSRASADATLSRLGINGHFSFICGYDSGHGQKPGRGMVDAFCAHQGLNAGEVVLVGDTPHDLDMGRAAGVGKIVGVLTGSTRFD
jgi:phosphoglycolate phosphatase